MKPEAALNRSTSMERRGWGGSTARSIRLCLVVALGLIGFYVVRYPIHGVHIALGSDTPVYVWWARRAGALGLGAFQAGPRPGFVAALAAMADVLHVPIASIASAVGPVLAASLGLVMAAFVDLTFGADRFRFGLTAVFTGTFLSLLVAGYFSTLAFGLLFVAALTCIAVREGIPTDATQTSRGNRSRIERWPVAAAAVLVAAAGLAHSQFLVLGAVVVVAAVAAVAGSARSELRTGVPLIDTRAGALGISFTAGGGAALAVVAALGPAARAHADTSRDAILRRLRLPALTRESYREVLRRFFPWFRIITVGGLSATALLTRARPPGSPDDADRRRLFWGAMFGWGAATVVTIVALIAGIRSPGQRLAAFCLPLPVLGAIGLHRLHDRFALQDRRPMAGIIGTVGAVLFVVVAFMGWGKIQPLISGDAASEFQTVGRTIARQPAGTPLILVVHDFLGDPGLRTTRYTNYLRTAVPPARMTDVHLFFGTPKDFLDGRPTVTGRFEHDRLAAAYWRDVERILEDRPVAVVLRALDPDGYAQALRLGASTSSRSDVGPGSGVGFLPGYGGASAPATGLGPGLTDVGAGPMSPWLPVWLSPLVILGLAALGWPWTRASVPTLGPLNAAALSPAFGLASLSLTAIVVDAIGVRLSRGGGVAAAALSLLLGALAWVWRRRTALG